ALGEDEAALLGLRLENLENHVLLAHAGGAGDVQVLRDLRELLDAHVLQIGDVQALSRALLRRRRAGGFLCRCGLRVFRTGFGLGRRRSVGGPRKTMALLVGGHESVCEGSECDYRSYGFLPVAMMLQATVG